MKKFLLIALFVFPVTVFAAPNDTTSQYKPTVGSLGSVNGTVVQFQDTVGPGAATKAVNNNQGLPVNCVSGCSGGGGGGAATIADGADVAEGATTDATATAGGAGTVSAKLRLATSLLDSVNTKTPTLVGGRQPVDGSGVTQPVSGTVTTNQGTSPWVTNDPGLPNALGQSNAAGSVSAVLASDQSTLPVAGNVAGAAVDSGNPLKIGCVNASSVPTYTVSGQRTDCQADIRGNIRVVLSGLDQAGTNALSVGAAVADASGSAASQVGAWTNGRAYLYNASGLYDRQRGDVNGAVSQPYAMTQSRWQYAAASGGITNTTTAVTMNASAGGSLRNYTTSCQVSADALGAATELAIRDGAGGTVLWRTKVQTAGLAPLAVTFPVPLKGTAATLIEVVTLTATITGGVYVNCQGFTGI